jgi:hypothetical protein
METACRPMPGGRPARKLVVMTNHMTQHGADETISDQAEVARVVAAPRTGARRALVVVGTALAALAVWALEDPIGGVDLSVRSGGSVQHVGAGGVIGAALLSGLVGWAVLARLERRAKRPHRTWAIVASTVFVISLAGPAGGVDAAAKLGLAALHVGVAAAVGLGLPAVRGRTSK